MAKTVKITFYNPKELWRMFWTKFFWPRRKKCAEWVDFMQAIIESAIISDILIGKFFNQGLIEEKTAEDLELDIRKAIEDCCKKTKKVIVTPYWEDEYESND